MVGEVSKVSRSLMFDVRCSMFEVRGSRFEVRGWGSGLVVGGSEKILFI
jgi:hypothetical protein